MSRLILLLGQTEFILSLILSLILPATKLETNRTGPACSVSFDAKSEQHAIRERGHIDSSRCERWMVDPKT